MVIKRYPRKLVDEIVARVKAGEKVMDLATQYGMSDRAIYNWLQEDSGDDPPSFSKYKKLKKENEQLKWLVGKLSLKITRGKKIEIASRAKDKARAASDLGLTRSSLYYSPKIPKRDLVLVGQIKDAHKEHPAYDYRRMATHLKVNHKRTERVMRTNHITPPRRKTAHYYTTRSASDHSYVNLIKKR